MRSPTLSRTIVFSDAPRLAAQVSCILARPGCYLPVVDGPRMTRPDARAEVTRRNNAAARTRATQIILAGLAEASDAALVGQFPGNRVVRIETIADLKDISAGARGAGRPPLVWGRDRIGVGLLRALRENRVLEFEDVPSSLDVVQSKSGHLVVCEEGEDLSEVIAANYAYSLRAGLCLVPEIPREKSRELLERLYSLYDSAAVTSPTERLQEVKDSLLEICPSVTIPPQGSITFITREAPLGFAFPQSPSTHLFSYPDLGIAVVNGFAAEQANTRGVNIGVLVDPGTVEAPEILAATNILSERRTFVRGYSRGGADVRSISDMVESFPYDLLMFATHCGDASGHRWTYRFVDSESIERVLVVDIALGIGRADNPDEVELMQFIRFHSLDGVDWNDPQKAEKIYIGRAIIDWTDRFRKDDLEPEKKEHVSRVAGSAALKMFDNNYLAMPQQLAGQGTPIVITNACASWHELAARFLFGNARLYIGTLFPVGTTEAHDVIVQVLGKQYGKPLAHALWSAQNAVYGDGIRRPYVATGVYPQRLRTSDEDAPQRVIAKLSAAATDWRKRLAGYLAEKNEFAARKTEQTIAFCEREVSWMRNRWRR